MGSLRRTVRVSFDSHRKSPHTKFPTVSLLRFFTFIERDQDPPSTAELANRLNTSVVLPVFYVSAEESGRLSANHFLSFEDGIIDSHVIRLARRFAGAFIYGAHKLDEPVLH